MKLLKIILMTLVATFMVATSVLQYHHHDGDKICFAIFSDNHHDEVPHDSSHDCGARIDSVDIIKAQLDKEDITAESLQLFGQITLDELPRMAEFSIDGVDYPAVCACDAYEPPVIGVLHFRAPPRCA